MSNKSIKKNYAYNVVYQILSLLSPIITAPYLSRILGADGIGLFSYIESVASYFVLVAVFGITTFGQREISYFQEDRENRSIVFWETFIIEFVISGIVLFVYILFSFAHSNWQYYIALSFNILSVSFGVTWFYQGIEEFGILFFRNIILRVINILYIFLCIKSKEDVLLYLLGSSLLMLFGNVFLWVSISKFIDKPNRTHLHPQRHLKTIFSLFIPTVAIQIYSMLDKTMIGIITNDVFENGYYEQASKISKLVLTIITALGTVMIPRIGYLFEKKDIERLKYYMFRGYRYIWFMGIPLCIGLILVASNFVPWFFGPGYDKVVPLLGILSLLVIIMGLSNVTGMQYLIPTKRQNIYTKSVFCGAITNVILNLVLIKLYKSYGAAIASVLAEATVSIFQIHSIKCEIPPIEILKLSKNYLVAGAVMGLVLYYIKNFFTPSIINTVTLIIIGAFAYFVTLILIRDDFIIDYLSLFRKEILKTR